MVAGAVFVCVFSGRTREHGCGRLWSVPGTGALQTLQIPESVSSAKLAFCCLLTGWFQVPELTNVSGFSGDARDGTDTPGRREPKESRRIEPKCSGPSLHERIGSVKNRVVRAAAGVTPSGLGGECLPPP